MESAVKAISELLNNPPTDTCKRFISCRFISNSSTPQLEVDTVCNNKDVTQMCHTDKTTGNTITWHWYNQELMSRHRWRMSSWYNQSQHGDNITVKAIMTGEMYTCACGL